MRLGISGTYSSGKTITAMALSHLTGIPRTKARTMREILPEAAPGKKLEECTAAELLQMILIRHTERAVHENRLADGFVSDGSSLQEWIYGTVRVIVGINPNDSIDLSELESVPRTPEVEFFEAVMTNIGSAMKRHVKASFDVFVHLVNELPLDHDGHRPVNDRFRRLSDQKLLATLDELAIPYVTVLGSIERRLMEITDAFGLARIISVGDAVEKARHDYLNLDVRSEEVRQSVGAL